MRDLFEKLIRIFRHPIRMAASAAAALCLVWVFTDETGRIAAVLGALSGLVLGELLGRSRLRSGVLVVAGLLGAAAVALADHLAVGVGLVPAILGPVLALKVGSLVSFGGGALLVASGLRAAAVRTGAGLAVEAGALAVAVAFAFSAHRDGSIARPLWLSDRAWDWGLDPVTVIMIIGALLSMALSTLLLLESRRRIPLIASGALPLLVIFVVMFTDPASLQTPPQVTDLSDIQDGFGAGEEDNDETSSPSGGGADGDEPQDGEPQDGDPQDGPPQPAGPGGDQPASPAEPGQGDPQGGQPGEGQGGTPQLDEDGEPSADGDESEPGDPSDILEQDGSSGGSPTPVAVVLLGDDYEPPSEGFYLRQEPMSLYNGSRLIQATRPDVDTDALDHFPPSRVAVTAPPSEHRVEIQGTVSLLTEHTAPFGIEAPIRFAPTRNPHPSRFVRTWSFTSLAQSTPYAELLGHAAGSPTWSEAVWTHYTDGPDDPRYAALARELVDQLPEELQQDPFAQALKIKLYLDENMRYTRESRHAEADDPTADFLFGDFTGYCVHSAHASVYLWRSLGLPARIGTGYLVEEADRRGSVLLVMNTAAHAWPEVYLKDVGWVVLDVAPSETLDPPAEPLDEDMLSALADLAREDERPPDRAPVDYAALWELLVSVLKAALTGLAVVLLVGSYTVKLWRRMRPIFASGATLPRVGYRSALDRLAEVGVVRKPGETRERFARRAAEVAPSFVSLTHDHLAAALSDPAAPPPPGDWRDHLRALRTDLRGSIAWWRRLLGRINPISFFWSR